MKERQQDKFCLSLAIMATLFATQAAAFDWVLHGPQNSYTSFNVTLQVPPQPTSLTGTWYYWPGLQTDSRVANYNPIGFGVLQPVLAYGPACHNVGTPPLVANPYASWYVAAWYVNLVNTPLAGYRGCYSGDVMLVNPGDSLLMSISKVPGSTVWTQTIVRQGKACSGGGATTVGGCVVTFSLDMKGQGQNRAELMTEVWNQAVVQSDVYFTSISLSTQNAEPANSIFFCSTKSFFKMNEVCTPPVLSVDGKTCTIQQCLFKKPGPFATGAVKASASASASAGSSNTTASNSNSGDSSSTGSIAPPAPPDDAPSDTNAPAPITGSSSDTSSSGSSASGIVWGSAIKPTNGTTQTPTSDPNIIPGFPNAALFGTIGGGLLLILGFGGALFYVYIRKRKIQEDEDEAEMFQPAPGGLAANNRRVEPVAKAKAASSWEYESPRENLPLVGGGGGGGAVYVGGQQQKGAVGGGRGDRSSARPPRRESYQPAPRSPVRDARDKSPARLARGESYVEAPLRDSPPMRGPPRRESQIQRGTSGSVGNAGRSGNGRGGDARQERTASTYRR